MSAPQDRRPGVRALAAEIARRNPALSQNACEAIAKQQLTMRHFDQLDKAKHLIEPDAAADELPVPFIHFDTLLQGATNIGVVLLAIATCIVLAGLAGYIYGSSL